MKLRNDPYQVFRFSRTPAGLYARQKWLGEADKSQWKTDFQETVDALLADQSPDGSWLQDTAATVKHLFGLHLTVRLSNAQINTALNWLLGNIEVQPEKVHVSAGEVASNIDLK
jgi:hypothetical protein